MLPCTTYKVGELQLVLDVRGLLVDETASTAEVARHFGPVVDASRIVDGEILLREIAMIGDRALSEPIGKKLTFPPCDGIVAPVPELGKLRGGILDGERALALG